MSPTSASGSSTTTNKNAAKFSNLYSEMVKGFSKTPKEGNAQPSKKSDKN